MVERDARCIDGDGIVHFVRASNVAGSTYFTACNMLDWTRPLRPYGPADLTEQEVSCMVCLAQGG